MKTTLIQEMINDFTEDMNAQLSNINKRKLTATTKAIQREFNKLCSMYPNDYEERLFRIAVANITPTPPTLSLVNDDYRFNIALTKVAHEYNRGLRKTTGLQGVA